MWTTKRPVLCSNKYRNFVCEPFLTMFWLVSWRRILLEDPALLPLEQSIIECLYYGLANCSFINFSSPFYSWHAEMNHNSPIPWYSPPYHHRRWLVTSLNSGNFCCDLIRFSSIHLLILLIEFLNSEQPLHSHNYCIFLSVDINILKNNLKIIFF